MDNGAKTYTSEQFGAGYLMLIEQAEDWGLDWVSGDRTPGMILDAVLTAMGLTKAPSPSQSGASNETN